MAAMQWVVNMREHLIWIICPAESGPTPKKSWRQARNRSAAVRQPAARGHGTADSGAVAKEKCRAGFFRLRRASTRAAQGRAGPHWDHTGTTGPQSPAPTGGPSKNYYISMAYGGCDRWDHWDHSIFGGGADSVCATSWRCRRACDPGSKNTQIRVSARLPVVPVVPVVPPL
jgi:hypothetical protein